MFKSDFKKANVLIGAIDLLILLYTVSIYTMSYSAELNAVSKFTALLIMGLTGIYLLINNKISSCNMFLYFALFIIFGIMSFLWAKDVSAVYTKMLTLLQIFVLTFLLYNYIAKENKLDYLIFVICISGTIFAVYTVLYFGVAEYFAGLEEGTRMGSEITNVNTIGLAAATSAIIALWYMLYRKKYIYVIPMIVCGIVAFGTGSRKVMICLVIGIVMLFVLQRNSKKRFKYVLQCILALTVLFLILQLPIFSTITERFKYTLAGFFGGGTVDSSTSKRFKMIEAGVEYFKRYPIGGIGLGNSNIITKEFLGGLETYLHNNYVELLACSGMIGFLLYYLMYLPLVTNLAKPSFKGNGFAVLGFTLVAIRLVLHYGMITYYSKTEYIMLVLLWLILSQIKGEKNEKDIKAY